MNEHEQRFPQNGNGRVPRRPDGHGRRAGAVLRSGLVGLWLLGLGAFAAGCSDTISGPTPCRVAGATEPCACDAGCTGVRTCDANLVLGECVCPAFCPADGDAGGDVPDAVEIFSPDETADETAAADGETGPPTCDEPGAFGFGCACVWQTDCASGFCIATDDDKVCTRTCVDECPPGWICESVYGAGPDLIFLCVPDVHRPCRPCTADRDCGPGGDRCVSVGAGSGAGDFCLPRCESDADCPTGYNCSDPEDPANGAALVRLCQPATRSCFCTADLDQTERECAITNEWGTCTGSERCDGANGWIDCTAVPPTAERCDQVDNDCNGLTDDGVQRRFYPDDDSDGYGAAIDPVMGCEQPDGYVPGQGDCADSDPDIHEGRPEICDGKDNDCNGLTDDGLGTLACGTGQCQRLLAACSAGQPTTCDPLEGAGAEVCDRVDNDCDGQTDEGLGSLTCGEGECAHAVAACIEGRAQTCDPLEGAAPERCDGRDNDCNGLTDDALAAPACPRQEGVCQGTIQTCGGTAGWQPCEYPNFEPVEASCDGEDNDCDGATDEDLPRPLCPVQLGVCFGKRAACAAGAWACTAAEFGSEYEAGGETRCDGLDNDCDGQVDDLAGQTGACALQEGVCAAAYSTRCVGGEWQCYTSEYGPLYEPIERSCDGEDNDCDGETDEDLLAPFCDSQAGVCRGLRAVCRQGGWACDYASIADYEDLEVTCDGLDNDCDGFIDAFLPPNLCPLQQGVCAGAEGVCAGGRWRCEAADYGLAYEREEASCDGLDNDCDGVVDKAPGGADLTRTCNLGCPESGHETCTSGAWANCSAPPIYYWYNSEELPGGQQPIIDGCLYVGGVRRFSGAAQLEVTGALIVGGGLDFSVGRGNRITANSLTIRSAGYVRGFDLSLNVAGHIEIEPNGRLTVDGESASGVTPPHGFSGGGGGACPDPGPNLVGLSSGGGGGSDGGDGGVGGGCGVPGTVGGSGVGEGTAGGPGSRHCGIEEQGGGAEPCGGWGNYGTGGAGGGGGVLGEGGHGGAGFVSVNYLRNNCGSTAEASASSPSAAGGEPVLTDEQPPDDPSQMPRIGGGGGGGGGVFDIGDYPRTYCALPGGGGAGFLGITAGTLTNRGRISALGGMGGDAGCYACENRGAGGGGGGGLVVLNIAGLLRNESYVWASGGDGGAADASSNCVLLDCSVRRHGGGGGGGGGLVAIKAGSVESTSGGVVRACGGLAGNSICGTYAETLGATGMPGRVTCLDGTTCPESWTANDCRVTPE